MTPSLKSSMPLRGVSRSELAPRLALQARAGYRPDLRLDPGGSGRRAAIGRPYAAVMSSAEPDEPDGPAADTGTDREPSWQDGAGTPDGLFQRLWMPHRMAYIKGENKPADAGSGQECPFCRIRALPDADALIVARGSLVYAVLNLYPYNSGHLLVCPYRHVADYTELDDGEIAELADFTKHAMRTLRTAAGAQGFNIGMNMGAVAGAGIVAHLHQHVVPRWGGDANFMPVVGRTKVLPQLLADTRDLFAEAWPGEG
jgi:ATP adenylyltransferase